MSHQMIGGVLHFVCDGVGGEHCPSRKNYSNGNVNFKETLRDAKSEGWSNYCVTVNSIDTWKIACPWCTQMLGG